MVIDSGIEHVFLTAVGEHKWIIFIFDKLIAHVFWVLAAEEKKPIGYRSLNESVPVWKNRFIAQEFLCQFFLYDVILVQTMLIFLVKVNYVMSVQLLKSESELQSGGVLIVPPFGKLLEF